MGSRTNSHRRFNGGLLVIGIILLLAGTTMWVYGVNIPVVPSGLSIVNGDTFTALYPGAGGVTMAQGQNAIAITASLIYNFAIVGYMTLTAQCTSSCGGQPATPFGPVTNIWPTFGSGAGTPCNIPFGSLASCLTFPWNAPGTPFCNNGVCQSTINVAPSVYPVGATFLFTWSWNENNQAVQVSMPILTVTGSAPVPDFFPYASPSGVSFLAGNTATTAITMVAINSFTGSATLTVATTPLTTTLSAPTVAISPSNSPVDQLTIGGSTPGQYQVTVTIATAQVTHTIVVSVTITTPPPPAPDFTITASPNQPIELVQGKTASVTLILKSVNSFSGQVNVGSCPPLLASCLPVQPLYGSGSQQPTWTASPTSVTISPAASANVTITLSGGTPGAYSIPITAWANSPCTTCPPPANMLIHSYSLIVGVVSGPFVLQLWHLLVAGGAVLAIFGAIPLKGTGRRVQ